MKKSVAMFAVPALIVASVVAAVLLMTVDDDSGLRIGYSAAPETLDPGMMSGVVESYLGEALFEGLMVQRPDGTLQPGVAESMGISDDGLTYTFKLRDDAHWVGPLADGDEPLRAVTAGDFEASWLRVLDPETASPYANIMYPIKNAENANRNRGLIGLLSADHGGGATDDIRVSWETLVVAAECAQDYTEDQITSARKSLTEEGEELEVTSRDALVAANTCKRNGLCGEFEMSARDRTVLLRDVPAPDVLAESLTPAIEAVDAGTLVVKLRNPTSYFGDLSAFHSFLPVSMDLCLEKHRDAAGKISAQWFQPQNIVTNGAFRLERYDPNRNRIVLVRNEAYWDVESIELERIVIKIYTDEPGLLAAYENGGLDIITTFSPKQLPALLKRDDFHKDPYLGTYYYRFNINRSPFRGERGLWLRRALAHAIDRDAVCEQLPDHPLPATGFVADGIPGYEPTTGRGFDLERSRRYLARAGYDRDSPLPNLKLLYNTSEGHQAIAEHIQDQLKNNLGYTGLELSNVEWKDYLATVRREDYSFARGGWIGDYVDPMTFLDMFTTGGGNNNTGFSDALYDQLIYVYAGDANSSATTPEVRQDILDALDDYRERANAPDSWLVGADEHAALDAILDPIESTLLEWDDIAMEDRRGALPALRTNLLRWAEHILVVDQVPIIPIFQYEQKRMLKDYVLGMDYSYIRQHTPWRFLSLDLPDPTAEDAPASDGG